MKRTLVILLAISLLANGALGVWLATRGAVAAQPFVEKKPEVAAMASAPSEVPPKPAEPAAKLWELKAGEDVRGYAARLRSAGVPDRTARLLVHDLLRQHYFARQRELIGNAEPAEFWKAATAAADRDRQAELRKLARAHQDLLGELYGADETVAAERERERRQYGPLPEEKLERVDRIHADYGEMAEDVRTAAGGLLLPTDRETLALLEQERRKDVAAVLSAEELELYDLQTSATARTLRVRLAAFAPTEKEFRALFALQRAFDERFAPANGASDEAKQRERAAAERELETRIAGALGEARYEDYRRTRDPGYLLAARIAERFGLPVRRAAEVFSLSQKTQARLTVLRDDKALTPAAAHAALATLARETGDRLATLLGGEGAELYRQTSAGAWMRALERAAATAPAETVVAAGERGEEKAARPAEPASPAPAAVPASAGVAEPQGSAAPLAAQPSG